MQLDELSSVAQDYLKVIWQATEWSAEPATTKALAKRFAVSPSTVSGTISRLAAYGLVVHEPYGAVELSEDGRVLALEMVRRHRLIETYLVAHLGYTWDEVHDEAERLEHAMSPLLVERIDSVLGRPTRDPHGDPIPSVSGDLPSPTSLRLSELPQGGEATIVRISDVDSSMLRHFASNGLHLDVAVTVVGRREYAGVVILQVADRETRLSLSEQEARLVWVDPAIRVENE